MKNLLAIAAVAVLLTACSVSPDPTPQGTTEMQPDDVSATAGDTTPAAVATDVQIARIERDFPANRFAWTNMGNGEKIMLDRRTGCVYRDDSRSMQPILAADRQPDCSYRENTAPKSDPEGR